ncbi:MAG: hypothetical protein L3V56_08635 [Candidatus Magnetoovum sp. WYHC-5]|nr:hypothetical protein [Candidatus Magnetoovum sp. WYHC-5]
MLKKYKNQLHDTIKQMGLNPDLFAASEQDNGKLFIVRVKYAQLKFTFIQVDTSFHEFKCEYTKYSPKFSDQYLPSKGITFEEAGAIFRHWLETHVRPYIEELESPDFWEEMANTRQFIGQTPMEEENFDFFSVKEKVLIKHALENIRRKMEEEFKPSKGEVFVLDKRILYLAESIDRLNHYDLKGLILLTVTSISAELRFDGNESRALFNLFSGEFNNVRLIQH